MSTQKSGKTTVVLIPCESYDPETVYNALKTGLELLGGLSSIIKPEERVLLKLNLVRGADVSRAVTTHPAVAEAMARLLSEEGFAHVKAGDSSGIGSSVKIMKDLGIDKALERYGYSMADFSESVKTDFPDGIHAKQFNLAKDVLEADAIVSLSKMKTHALEHITGALKNQYGCVQGASKAIGHTQYPSPESFARMLADLNRLLKPRLFIMDGITAMEGNGPTSGDPVPMNVLLLSRDCVALDAVFSHLVYLDPEIVPTIRYGEEMGLGTWQQENIELLTPGGPLSIEEAVRKYGDPDFNVVRKRYSGSGIMGALGIFRIFHKKPYIIKDRCRKCGICVKSCPMEGKALRFDKGKDQPPVYHYRSCIRCFCCQEMCPHKAIAVK